VVVDRRSREADIAVWENHLRVVARRHEAAAGVPKDADHVEAHDNEIERSIVVEVRELQIAGGAKVLDWEVRAQDAGDRAAHGLPNDQQGWKIGAVDTDDLCAGRSGVDVAGTPDE